MEAGTRSVQKSFGESPPLEEYRVLCSSFPATPPKPKTPSELVY